MKVLIVKKEGIDIEKELKILKEKEVDIVNDKPEYILTFGGDGTILKALKLALKYEVPIIPVNFGKVGYMAEIEAKELPSMLDNIKKGEFDLSKRSLLDISMGDKKYYALNDIVFKNENVDEITVFDGLDEITKFRGDGLIISTPTGSTAYAMSAGGSIIHPGIKALNLVAIASQYLASRPLILPNIPVRVVSKSNIYIDGMKVEENNEVNVSLSDKYIQLVQHKGKSYYLMLKKKLEWR